MRGVWIAAVLTGLLLCGCSSGRPEIAAGGTLAVPLHSDETVYPAQAQPDETLAALTSFTDIWAASVSGYPEAIQVLLAHELLCRSCRYDLTAENRHSAYGALLEGRAVCDGYADAFSLLMDAVGISAMTVIGTARDADGSRIAHAWNLVQLEGVWYHIDCTWDDTEEETQYTYFLCDDAVMLQDHEWAQNKYPPAEGGGYRYETIVQEMLQQLMPSDSDAAHYSSLG